MPEKKKLSLHVKIFIGLLSGLLLGLAGKFLLPPVVLGWIVANVARLIGQAFLKMIFCAVVPLAVAAVALGVSNMGATTRVGRITVKALAFTVLFSGTAVIIGIAGVNIAGPGRGVSVQQREAMMVNLQSSSIMGEVKAVSPHRESFADTLVGLLPKNPFNEATNAFTGGLIPLLVFSIIMGLAMNAVGPEKSAPLKALLESVFAVMLKIIGFAMKFAPYGIAGLLFAATAGAGFDAISMLIKYFLLVVACLAIHMFGFYSLALKVFTRRSPLVFFRACTEVIVTAFATSSSSATLPVALKTATDKLRVPPQIAQFIVTLGATTNHNGTALYEGVTVLFLAQLFGVALSLGQQFFVVGMCIMASIGTAGVPGGSLPFLVVVLQYIGVPLEGIGLIMGLDRVLDMCRTVINVVGDLAVAVCLTDTEKDLPAPVSVSGGA